MTGWSRLAILHFPTNGFQTDRIVQSVERIAGRGPARTIVTVSLDGDEALNDEIRGIKGGFRRQIETFKALRRIPGIVTALGMTLSTHNLGQFERTFAACARECPGLTVDDMHLNVAQRSGHYYGNAEMDAIAPDPAVGARRDGSDTAAARRPARSPRQLLENAYLKNLDRVSADRPDADAVPRAARELLHRSLGRRLSVHHLLEADRPPARHRHAARPDLERRARPRRCRARSGRDSARSAGPPARRIRAFSATRWRFAAPAPSAGRRRRARRRPTGLAR